VKIGVISDTHGHVPEEALAALAGVEHILHAGDVGPMAVIQKLECIAPVTAVRGNTDHGIDLPETAVFERGEIKFLLHHIVDYPKPTGSAAEAIKEYQPDVVVFGHTHMPCDEDSDGLRWLNPGSAAQPRGLHAASIMLIEVGESLGTQLVVLDRELPA
tara:strand:- start:606 stop:1082 length:477 start_codon:yes stop_codon:yes gene_type:complete